MPTYRLIVAIDVDAPNLEDAYETVYRGMGRQFGNDWESTDEAYDGDGEPIDEDTLSQARIAVLGRLGTGRPAWGIPRRPNALKASLKRR